MTTIRLLIRPFFHRWLRTAASLAFMVLWTGRVAQAEQVIIGEIMYHPPGSKPAWVEIENLTSTPFDIADWNLSGAEMRFRFPKFSEEHPARTILKPFERLVISSVAPDRLREGYRVPENARVLGPWMGVLKHSKDRLVLKDKNGVTRSQVRYRDGGDWPIAADGAGHTLVLRNIHEPVDDWRNWRASTDVLGSPGLAEIQAVNGADSLGEAVIDEVHFASDRSVDWVELVHRSGWSFAAGELRVASKRDFSDAVTVTGSLGSGERTVVDLNFRSGPSENGRRLYLTTSAGQVLDARDFSIIPSEESWQRWPEKSGEWYRGSEPSRGSPNHPERHDEIVINEIMYDPPSDSGCGEFIELLNRGQEHVDLSRWQFTDGVEFKFPSGTVLEPGAYLVVSANAKALTKTRPDILVLGNYRGKLSNDGDRVRLEDTLGNLVSEVDYRTGGTWPAGAAGGGSSMEKVHSAMDGQLASAWKSSDESHKSHFETFAHRGVYEERNPLGRVSDHRELHFFMVEEGHVELRNIRLWNTKSGEDYLSPGARESHDGTGAIGWLIQGNHSASYWDGDVLHLISEGHGDNRANRIEIDIPEIQPGAECELRFEARWISGSPRLIAQTWDHSFSFSMRLPIPADLGTPGRANSRLSADPVPQLDQLRHSPVVPAPGEPVRISASVTSTEPPKRVTVFHRLDSLSGNAEWRSTDMNTAPLVSGETAERTREYSASLTDYSEAGQVVQFYVRAETSARGSQELPTGGRDLPAMYVVDGRNLPDDLRTSRFVVSARDLASIADGGTAEYGYRHPKVSNHYLNGTLISNERDVWYNIEVRRSGSAWNRSDTLSRGKWKAPADHLFRGRRKWVFDDDTAGSRRYSDRVTRYLLYLLGNPTSESEFVRVVVNAGPVDLREEVEPVDADFLRRIYPGEEIGDLYRIDDEWWFADSWEPETRDADWSYKGTSDPGRYRTEWMKRTHEADDDFSGLINFFNLVSSPDYSEDSINALIDADAVLQLAAVSGYIANWDTFTMSRGKNAYFYQRAVDGRFRMFHWDSDAAFEREQGEPFYGDHEPFRRWLEQPYNFRLFTKYLGEIVSQHTEGSPRMHAWLEAQNLTSPDTGCDIERFEAWFRMRNAFARERFGDALIAQ